MAEKSKRIIRTNSVINDPFDLNMIDRLCSGYMITEMPSENGDRNVFQADTVKCKPMQLDVKPNREARCATEVTTDSGIADEESLNNKYCENFETKNYMGYVICIVTFLVIMIILFCVLIYYIHKESE